MADPIRLDVPADPHWLGVVGLVVGASPAFAADGGEALDDLAIAVGEVAAEVEAAPGVEALAIGIDGDRIDVVGTGTEVEWAPGPLLERLVPGLANVSWELGPSAVMVSLSPRA